MSDGLLAIIVFGGIVVLFAASLYTAYRRRERDACKAWKLLEDGGFEAVKDDGSTHMLFGHNEVTQIMPRKLSVWVGNIRRSAEIRLSSGQEADAFFQMMKARYPNAISEHSE